MTNTIKLNNELYVSKVDHSELSQILLSYFGQSSDFEPNGQKYTKKENSKIYLDVLYDSKGNIIEITCPSTIAKDEINNISRKIKEELIENQDISIGQEICYAVNIKVAGYFSYDDMFQIIPVPNKAPKPNFQMAHWPFLLQFKYTSSSNTMVSHQRKAKKFREIVQLLHFFSKGRLIGGSRYVDFAWVYSSGANGNLSSECKQVGYAYKGFSGIVSSYTPTNKFSKIKLEPYKDFYNLMKSKIRNVLILPDNLEVVLSSVYNLDTKNQKRFFTACYWFYVASQTWSISHSGSYAALITALEALIEKWESCNICGNPINIQGKDICVCGQPRYRITKTFGKFLDTYVPNINELPMSKNIYKIRSKILHGIHLFYGDKDPMNFIDKRQQDEDMFQRAMHDITFFATLNWLKDKSR